MAQNYTMWQESKLYHEMCEQPLPIERLLDSGRERAQEIAEAARSTSDNAGRYANYVFEALNGIPVALAAPSLYSVYKKPPNLINTLVLGISQSGQSPDIVAVLAEATRQGALTAVITNAPQSPLAQQAEFLIDLQAGKEQAVAATKTYTAELVEPWFPTQDISFFAQL